MKAAVIYGAKDIRIEDIEMPEPKKDEALVKIDTVGICGSDMHYYKNGRIGSRIIDKPHILGHELSGIIESVGENNLGLKNGMAVGIEPSIPCGECEPCTTGKYNLCKEVIFCGSPPFWGGMREYMACPVTNLEPMPGNVSVEEGILLETFSIGVHCIDVAGIKLGDSVAIFGTGNIGLTLLQLAKSAGAANIIVVDLLDYRLKIAEKMGASAVINANNEDPVEKIMKLTNGRGVDIGFEAAGEDETPHQTMCSVKQGGTFVFVGIIPLAVIQWDTEVSRKKELTIKMIHRSRHGYDRAFDMVKNENIDFKSYITHRFPLEKADEAFKTVLNYKDNVLKAVIKP